MAATNASPIPKATNAETDFKSPASEDLIQRKFRDALNMLEDFIADNGLGILKGAVDSPPPNSSPSYIVDVNPTVGRISFDDKFNDMRLEMLSGVAIGQTFRITDTDGTNKRLYTTENLFIAGVTTGDLYRIQGHNHDGLNSRIIDLSTLPLVSKEFDPGQRVYFRDEFFDHYAAGIGSPITTRDNWKYQLSNTIVNATVAPTRPGIFEFSGTGGNPTAASHMVDVNGGAFLKRFYPSLPGFSFKAGLGMRTSVPGAAIIESVFALSTAPTIRDVNLTGFGGGTDPTVDQLQIGFRWDNTGPNTKKIKFRVVVNGVATELDGGSFVLDTLYDLEMRRTSAGVWECFVNQVSIGSIAAADPVGACGIALDAANNASAVNPLGLVDYWDISFDRP